MKAASNDGWIVDASVILKWFLPRDAEHDFGLAREAVANIPMKTTSLAFYEVGNVLTRMPESTPGQVRASLDALTNICGNPIELTSADFAPTAEIAAENRVTFYDASYVAIAKRVNRRVLSADSDLLGPGLASDLKTALS